ncbi:leucine zipper domain-containing protein [Streptomyces sp. NPDC005283]
MSRQAYCTWYRRYQAEGAEGLRTRSKAPKRDPCRGGEHLSTTELPLGV